MRFTFRLVVSCLGFQIMMLLLSCMSTAPTRVRAFVRTLTPKRHGPTRLERFRVTAFSEDENLATKAFSSSSSSSSSIRRPVVQWYPGHIAKAERQLQETLKAVDVVVEVRHAQAPQATSHPSVATWSAGKPRLVVLTHSDHISLLAKQEWQQSFAWQGIGGGIMAAHVQNQAAQALRNRQDNYDSSHYQQVLFVNAKLGTGIPALKREIFKAGSYVQERRQQRGLSARALRVGLIGYPNVGKSALINRLLGRKRARTANTPGITRSLQWIRVKENTADKREFELLDSPGIIPATLVNQDDANLLAACNCIGDAAYDNQGVAAYWCEWMLQLEPRHLYAPEWRSLWQARYHFDPLSHQDFQDGTTRPRTGDDLVYTVAENTCRGNVEDAARKILQDFRTGRLGPICLQVARNNEQALTAMGQDRELDPRRLERKSEQAERAQAALERARERGLELPSNNIDNTSSDASNVGKGMFEGW